MEIGKFILNMEHEYNGHKQLTVEQISLSELYSIVRSIEKFTKNELKVTLCAEPNVNTFSFSVEECDYWDENEHRLGHKDRILLGGTLT